MSDFKLKIILSGLGGVMFAFILILLSFILPAKESATKTSVAKPKNRLEAISQSLNK